MYRGLTISLHSVMGGRNRAILVSSAIGIVMNNIARIGALNFRPSASSTGWCLGAGTKRLIRQLFDATVFSHARFAASCSSRSRL